MTKIELEVMIVSAIERAAQGMAAQFPAHQTPDELLTVADISKTMKVGKSGAYEFLKSGAIPCIKMGGKMKVRRKDLEAYLAQNVGMDLTDPAHPVPLNVKNEEIA